MLRSCTMPHHWLQTLLSSAPSPGPAPPSRLGAKPRSALGAGARMARKRHLSRRLSLSASEDEDGDSTGSGSLSEPTTGSSDSEDARSGSESEDEDHGHDSDSESSGRCQLELELEAASAYVAPHSGWHCSQVFSSLFCVQVRLGLVMVVEARAGVAVLPSAPGTRHGLAGVRLTSRLAHAARWCTSSTTSQSLAISSWMTSLVGSSSTRLVCTARIAPRPIHAVKSTRTPLLLVLVGPRDLEPPSWRHQSCLWDREIYISARAVPRQQFTSPVQSHNARKTNLLQPLSHNYEIPDALANTVHRGHGAAARTARRWCL